MAEYKFLLLFYFLLQLSGAYRVKFGGGDVQTSTDRKLFELEKGVIRSRNFNLPTNRPRVEIGEEIEFELFDGEVYVGSVNHVVDRGEDVGATWAGTLASPNEEILESSNDWFTLSCHLDACTANLEVESRRSTYVIRPSPAKQGETVSYTISEIGEKLKSGTRFHKSLVNNKEPDVLSNSDIRQNAAFATSNVDTDQIIDIGVMYTPEALAYMGNSEAAMVSQVYLATDEANQILQRSAVSLRIRVVFCFRTANASFVEPGDDASAFGTMLGWLQNPTDGYLDEAHVYREQYGADFLLLVNECGAYGGLGYVNTGPSPSWAMANYNVRYLYGLVWMHEMGHIQGCFHDRFSASLYSDPTWKGYGNCWEDTSKTDCTCYSSVMVYDCNTEPNHCTHCSSRNFLANYKVIDAGSPTGLPLASCGLHIHERRFTPIAYRKSIYNSGLIFSVSPSAVQMSLCATVNISGWALSYEVGDSIISVTLAGVPAAILSQTNHTVVVRAPNVTSASIRAGDVVVTTQLGRVSVARGAFKYTAMQGYFMSDLSSKSLSSTIWSSTGVVSWSIQSYGGPLAITKGSGVADTDIAELTSTGLLKVTASRPCYDVVKSISFRYWAYSPYGFCYNGFKLSAQSGSSSAWTVVWTGTTYYTGGYVPWRNVSAITLPADTRQVKFNLYTSSNTYCRYWTPLYLTDINMYKTTTCSAYMCPGPSYTLPAPPDPTSAPTLRPSTVPTRTPSVPTFRPTSRPTSSPTVIPNNTAIFSYGNSIAFNGTGKYPQYPSVSYRFTDKFSLSLWVNATSNNGYLVSLGRSPSNVMGEMILQISGGWLLFWDYGYDVSGGSGYGFYTWSANAFKLRARQHVVVVKDNLKLTYYINGLVGGSGTASRSVQYTNSILCFGWDCRDKTNYFKGTLDHIAFYRDALTPSQVQSLYSQAVTTSPTTSPTSRPSVLPTRAPTTMPTTSPSLAPTSVPTFIPSKPTAIPTIGPTMEPSLEPTPSPTDTPTTPTPTESPTSAPSMPSVEPTAFPSSVPSESPTSLPTLEPTTPTPSTTPSNAPSTIPSEIPSRSPTTSPTVAPSQVPTRMPSTNPTVGPTTGPTVRPTIAPSAKPTTPSPSTKPSSSPSSNPTLSPSASPSAIPSSKPSVAPTTSPSVQPSIVPTTTPSSKPSFNPSSSPTQQPSVSPTVSPSTSTPSTTPTVSPSATPTLVPTPFPSTTPTIRPSIIPTASPSERPSSVPTITPSATPSVNPSSSPTFSPTPFSPTKIPVEAPTLNPSVTPSISPSIAPSESPSAVPTDLPSTTKPSASPSMRPVTYSPSSAPSSTSPTKKPTSSPTFRPVTSLPTMSPSRTPTSSPSRAPSRTPTTSPSRAPTMNPSIKPTTKPSSTPTVAPTMTPSVAPTSKPSTPRPTPSPSQQPSSRPSSSPSAVPSRKPSASPSMAPSRNPTARPSSAVPSSRPTRKPTGSPTSRPSSSQPSRKPTVAPSSPSRQPVSVNPTVSPTAAPSLSPTAPPSVPTTQSSEPTAVSN